MHTCLCISNEQLGKERHDEMKRLGKDLVFGWKSFGKNNECMLGDMNVMMKNLGYSHKI